MPDDKPAESPQQEARDGDREPTPGEVLALVGKWLRHRLGIAAEKPKWTDAFTALLTVIIAAAGFWSAWLFQGQLTEARKTTRVSIESFRVDERAWIELQPFQPILRTPASGGFSALFTYNIFPKNVGKTAAYDITAKATRGGLMSGLALGDSAEEIASYQRILQSKNAAMPDEVLLRRVPRMLGPGETSNVLFDVYGAGPEAMKGLYEFLIGRLDYVDAFQVRHWITFCFFYI